MAVQSVCKVLLVCALVVGCSTGAQPAADTTAHQEDTKAAIVDRITTGELGHAQGRSQEARKVAVVGIWTDGKCKCLLRGEEALAEVPCKKAICEIVSGETIVNRIPINVFIVPGSGHAWAGLEQDFYVDTEQGAIGIHMMAMDICWCLTLTANPMFTNDRQSRDLNSLVKLMESKLTVAIVDDSLRLFGNELGTEVPRRTSLIGVIDKMHFSPSTPTGVDIGQTQLLGIAWDDELLKLDMTNMTGEIGATAWIDVKTRKAVRGVRDKYEPE